MKDFVPIEMLVNAIYINEKPTIILAVKVSYKLQLRQKELQNLVHT